jgi:hypothetical protein
MRTVGKPKGHTREAPISEEIISIPSETKKPESVFNQNDISENQTSISDISEDLDFENNSFLGNLFKNEENKNNKVSYQIIPSNFKVVNGRILGSVNVKSTGKPKEKVVLHASFFPLDVKQNKLGEKINGLNFTKDLHETININESSHGLENITMNLHVMKGKEHVSNEVWIDVLKSDSQDMPEKEKEDNTSKYIVIGVGLLGLALIIMRIRKK